MLAVTLIAGLIVGALAFMVDADLERFVTALLTFANTVILVWQSTKVRRVEDVAAITKRTLGERTPGRPVEPWDGVDRRRSGHG